MPQTADGTELYIHFFFFSYACIPMIKFNLKSRHSKRLSSIPNNKIEVITIYCSKSYVNMVSHSLSPFLSKYLLYCTHPSSCDAPFVKPIHKQDGCHPCFLTMLLRHRQIIFVFERAWVLCPAHYAWLYQFLH